MYAFIHIPKTAGTTLRSQLRDAFGPRHCDVKVPSRRRDTQTWVGPRDLRYLKKIYPVLNGICGHRVTCFSDLDRAAPEIRYFTFLRDPVRRFISHFHHAYRGRTDECTADDLAAYAADPANCNIQTRWLCGQNDAALAIRYLDARIGLVGLTERFDASLVLLYRWLGQPPPTRFGHALNRCRGTAPLRYTGDPALLAIITEANQLDLEVYHHASEIRYPRQIEDYGEDCFAEDMACLRERPPPPRARGESAWSRTKRNLLYKPMLHLLPA